MSQELMQYPSKSNPAKHYSIILGDDGVTYCTCMAWKMANPHTCRHLEDFLANTGKPKRIISRARRTPGPDPLSQAIDAAVKELSA